MAEEYYKTKESVQEYIQLAKDVNGKELIDKLKQVLPHQSTLLELGSGPGTDWSFLDESYNVIGSDNSKEFIAHLNETRPNGEFLLLDAITIDTINKFDGIYSNKVLHHLENTALTKSIQRQHQILNAEGIICHSFWKGEGSETFKGMFVNYHTEENLEKIFSEYFDIISIDSYQEFDKDDSVLLIGKKK